MRVIVQRVRHASVTIDGEVHGSVGRGYMTLTGFTDGDTEETVKKVADKVADLRIFEDENDKMNLTIFDVGGAVLSISQFTLYADVSKGRRPSFVKAMRPQPASQLYDFFNECLRKRGLQVETGIFGADMKVELLNDGPVTIIVDSEVL